MPYFDSHTHLHDSRIVSDLSGIVERARKAGVTGMASCATMEENFDLTAEISRQYPEIIPFFGIHPWFIAGTSPGWEKRLEKKLKDTRSGVGETGIDFTDKTADRDFQISVFKTHLELAIELGRPINIHVRKAWDTFIHIIKYYGPLKVPGMIHSYSGSADMVGLFEKQGLYISFSGSVTNPGSKKVVAALRAVSQDRFVLETDTPDIYPYIEDLDPAGLNEPKNIPAIAAIAAKRIVSNPQQFCENAYTNSLAVFAPVLKGENRS